MTAITNKLKSIQKISALFLVLILLSTTVSAQILDMGPPKEQPKPKAEQPKTQPEAEITNYKVLSEVENPDGSVVRKVRFNRGQAVVTQTVISPPKPKIGIHKAIKPDTMNHDSVMVYIDRENYLVAVIYKKKRIRQYQAVFGPDRLLDKMQEGDRCTPQGWFKVISKKEHNAWSKFILLDYPNKESYTKFAQRKKAGLIPSNARIGGNIGIHGTTQSGAGMVDIGLGWTDGCISLKPKDVEDLYKLVWPGTRVYIK